MNLVAKEYLASKKYQRGVLVLSKTAGAAEELKDAVMVDPTKPRSLVQGLSKALTMQPAELKRRVQRMQTHLAESDVHVWASKFTSALKQDIRLEPGGVASLPEAKFQQITTPFTQAKHPLILLDYDGVLEPFHRNPANAEPTTHLQQLLTQLSERADIVVISGRRKDELESWLGDLPISLVAEHGAYSRRRSGKAWRSRYDHAHREVWKHEVSALMERYAARTPGARIETKDASLVWHYRTAQPYAAQKYLVALRRLLKPVAARHNLSIEQGNKILEVRPANINKGMAALTWIKPNTDFALAIGDDRTDEYMFTLLPPTALTIKVGRGRTSARYRISNVSTVLKLLEKLARK
jgi:trehalose 6-phosphate synthase/phosphatase